MWIETDRGVVNLDFVAGIAQNGQELRLLMPPTSPDDWIGKNAYVKITTKTPAAAKAYYNRIIKQLDVLTRYPDDCDGPFADD